MISKMDWEQLLSSGRLGSRKTTRSVGRSQFQRDFDRIIFSSSFRRLQDKAQVVPLSQSDYVRTRLTHSLEVSSVGRSLGTEVGLRLRALSNHASDVGAIVAAACVAHDIGNPPFGHSGEEAIQSWFKRPEIKKTVLNDLSTQQQHDFLEFEGNAQGFRILTCIQNPINPGGLQLTYGTLGAFTKYPREAFSPRGLYKGGRSTKKFGYFQAEKKLFKETANGLGLLRRTPDAYCWARHPFAFLVEAADDICYHIIDFEDGFKLGRISFKRASEPLKEIVGSNISKRLKSIVDNKDKIQFLRAKAISTLIAEVTECFVDNERGLLSGKFDKALIDEIPSSEIMKHIYDVSTKYIYSAAGIVEIEAAGFNVLGGLLEAFIGAANDVANKGSVASKRSQKFLQLIPSQFLGLDRQPSEDNYIRLLQVTDFVSGMTDSYAVSLYKKIMGISLPTA